MDHSFGDFFDFVSNMSISEKEKEALCQLANSCEKQLLRMDFQMKRTLKDKSIIINLLNKTIEDLRTQQHIVEQANIELSRQKAEIEAKNIELQSQKQVVEEQSLTLANNLRELEMSYNELEQFSYIASHDLKSPLRTIASYAGLLKRRYVDTLDHDAHEFVDFIVKGASHMNDIIGDLLVFSNSGKNYDITEIDLNETLSMVKHNLQLEIAESDATIIYGPLPSLKAHRSGILQLFQNLIGNAIKFKGTIPPVVTILARQEDKYWHFEVADNGLGLDENYQHKAFLPFQRINHLDLPGTGMGLAICKKVVKKHHGEIWYVSKPGQGTTFHFTVAFE